MGFPGVDRIGRIRLGGVAIAALLLAGCAAVPPPPAGNRVLAFEPASLGHSLVLSQRVVGSHADKQYKMRFEVNLSGNRLVIVGLSEFGMTLFTIVQEGEAVDVDTPGRQALPLDPAYLLSDFYLVQWPDAPLAAAYAQRGLQFESRPDGRSRRVRDGDGRVLVEVTYAAPGTSPETRVRHHDPAYELRILTLHRRSTP